MIPDEDCRTHGVQVLLPRDDLEAYVCCVAHAPFEGAGCGVLGQAVEAYTAEGDGGEDAIEGAEDEGAVGGEGTAVEG